MWRFAAVGLIVAAATAGTPEGKAALERGDYDRARSEFTTAAEAGEAEAQFQLGEMFRRGLGVRANPRLAKSWYERASGQGHGAAAGELGILLWKAKKRDLAAALLRKGADAGHVRAMYVLAMLDYRGNDVGIGDQERWKLFRRAAEGGHPDAQATYASALKRGKIDGNKRIEDAEQWYRKAAVQGHPGAHTGVGLCMFERSKVPGGGTNITAQREALDWVRKGALRGDYLAQHFLALARLKMGNYAEAYAWTKIGSRPRNAWPAGSPAIKKLYKGYAESLKDVMKKVRRYTSPEQEKEGKRLAKQYLEQIKAHMKKGLPWEDPDR